MATLRERHEEEVKRMRDTYGKDAEIPHPPSSGRLGYTGLVSPGGTPVTPVTQRLAELAQQVSEAGHTLHLARAQFMAAQEARGMAEKTFVEISERLLQTIHEHRESVPENVPYGLR